MKRFIISVLCVSVFFLGLGAMIENVGARFKSDEKALEIIRNARIAIGGEAAIKEIRSLTIVGRTAQTVKVNGVDRTENGETEIALQLPDKMMKMIKIGDHNGKAAGHKVVSKEYEVVIIGKSDGEKVTFEGKDGEFKTADSKTFTIKKGDGDETTWKSADGKTLTVHKGEGKGLGKGVGVGTEPGGKQIVIDEKIMAAHHGAMRQNELLRTTLALLLSAPEGMDVSYTFAGEGDVDGTAVNIVNASFGGATYKLFIGRSTNLPVAISYTGHRMPKIAHFNKEVPPPADGKADVVMFKRKGEPTESAEFTVRFTDYRNTGGVQLPYKWTTTVAGQTEEVFDVTSYDLNPANIAEKFKGHKTFVRTKKPDGQ